MKCWSGLILLSDANTSAAVHPLSVPELHLHPMKLQDFSLSCGCRHIVCAQLTEAVTWLTGREEYVDPSGPLRSPSQVRRHSAKTDRQGVDSLAFGSAASGPCVLAWEPRPSRSLAFRCDLYSQSPRRTSGAQPWPESLAQPGHLSGSWPELRQTGLCVLYYCWNAECPDRRARRAQRGSSAT